MKAYRAKYGKVPSYFSESNYSTAQMIDEVMSKNDGKILGAEEFIKQLSAMKFDTVRGPVSFDETQLVTPELNVPADVIVGNKLATVITQLRLAGLDFILAAARSAPPC